MANRPLIKQGDWIQIGSAYGVVSLVRPEGDQSGDCEVVSNPDKPINSDAKWVTDHWEFIGQGGGYADRYDRLSDYVRILKHGRFAQS